MKKNTLFIIDDIFVSGEVTDQLFACDLAKCKGACCVGGDLGAPLEKEELSILKEILPAVKPYMRPEGIEAIEILGEYVEEKPEEYTTPLVNGAECAYVTFNPQGIAFCAIEQAYFDGKINFRKPISCHLYPIRIHKTKRMESLNYDEWDICSAACIKGKQEGIPVYQFVKEALIRKYGEGFFTQLDAAVQSEEK